MLANLSLKNIKSFNKEATLKIAPITLIYGANSSGKSTLWKFLTTLKHSLIRGGAQSFLNFDRSYGFANSKTISFNPDEDSTFSFKFSSLKEYFETTQAEESDAFVPIFLRESKSSKKDDDADEKKGIKFVFNFTNENFTETPIAGHDLSKLNEMAKRIHSKNRSMSIEDQQILKNIELIKQYTEEMQKAEFEMKSIKKQLASKKKDLSVTLNKLTVFKDDKCFAIYKIFPLENSPARMRMSGRGTREFQSQQKQRAEAEILDILKKEFPKDFEFQIGLEGDDKEIHRFDFIGPVGPHELKIDSENPIKYLFIPEKISDDKFFWEEHYNFLQHIKKLIKNNSDNKNKKEPEIYKEYFEEELRWAQDYYEMKGITIDRIPQIQNGFDKILKAMTASLEDFAKIMSEDLRTRILRGNSFIPNKSMYGGDVYRSIFDALTSKFVDAFVETDVVKLSKEGKEFLNIYSVFNKYSYDDQFTNLYKFPRELRGFRENSNSDYRLGTGMGGMRFNPRFLAGALHEDPKHKSRIIKLLEKINLPFNIQTQSDKDGDVKISFANKNIANSQMDIPLEQSGNGLQSVLSLLNGLTSSENDTIIIEEPENKIHPKIQGNLIELIAELVKENGNYTIIETHSEHFILRIQKLIREKKISPDFVSINYVYLDDDGKGSQIDHMKLNQNGKFINKWRHGFFNERLNEL
jgi:AAA15 family ATPase/GTPase